MSKLITKGWEMHKNILTIIEYISYLFKNYTAVQQVQLQNRCSISSIQQTKNGTKIIFQIIGKSIFMESSPQEILSNNDFTECFSKKDIQKIIYAQINDQNENQFNQNLKLIYQEFNAEDGKTKFVLKDKKENITLKTASEIILDKKIVKKLTQEDAINIGYIAGYEHSNT